MKYITIGLLACWLISCKEKQFLKTKSSTRSYTEIKSYIDTTIILKHIEESDGDFRLTEKKAKATLYEYFKNQPDIISQEELKGDVSENTNTFSYDTIYNLKIKNKKIYASIISYWITPAYGSSRCYMPHRAIISKTKKGYKISNEDFISSWFLIDSIADGGKVFSSYYECPNDTILRYYSIDLKTK